MAFRDFSASALPARCKRSHSFRPRWSRVLHSMSPPQRAVTATMMTTHIRGLMSSIRSSNTPCSYPQDSRAGAPRPFAPCRGEAASDVTRRASKDPTILLPGRASRAPSRLLPKDRLMPRGVPRPTTRVVQGYPKKGSSASERGESFRQRKKTAGVASFGDARERSVVPCWTREDPAILARTGAALRIDCRAHSSATSSEPEETSLKSVSAGPCLASATKVPAPGATRSRPSTRARAAAFATVAAAVNDTSQVHNVCCTATIASSATLWSRRFVAVKRPRPASC